ncbi:Class I glutamine amidotransferase-like [Phytophthora cactorum]|nr:Class I glutamine amidotransferase-like [Phytophthora cactorum]
MNILLAISWVSLNLRDPSSVTTRKDSSNSSKSSCSAFNATSTPCSGLAKGDIIAFVAPASGLAALVSHRLTKAGTELERLGFRVKVYPSVTREPQDSTKVQGGKPDAADRAACSAYSSTDAETRADELMQAFRDPDVKAIICTIGGFTSTKSWNISTSTSLQCTRRSFVGSRILRHSISPCMPSHSCAASTALPPSSIGGVSRAIVVHHTSFLNAVQSMDPLGDVAPSTEWTDDKTANWFTRADITYQDKMKPNLGYTWLRSGTAEGPILGGCLPTLLQFDQGMALSDVNVALGWLRADGTFKKIRGLIVGRAFAYSEAQVEGFQRLIRHHTRGTSFPVLYGVDVGHTNPIATIPLGCLAELDAAPTRLKF